MRRAKRDGRRKEGKDDETLQKEEGDGRVGSCNEERL